MMRRKDVECVSGSGRRRDFWTSWTREESRRAYRSVCTVWNLTRMNKERKGGSRSCREWLLQENPMTSKQRAYLKSLAMVMEPILQVGKGSVTPEFTASVAEAL